MSFVLKIKCGESLRRLVVPRSENDGPEITYNELEFKVREYFGISPASKVTITYVDNDDDVVTMSETSELVDACVSQDLNPLRLSVTLEDGGANKVIPDAKDSAYEALNMMLSFVVARGSTSADVKQLEEDLRRELQTLRASKATPDTKHPVHDATIGRPELKFLEKMDREILKLRRLGFEGCSATPAPASAPATPATCATPVTLPGPVVAPPVSFSNIGRTRLDGVHFNVQCDVCGVTPIVGPRFKSLKRHNYDLCTTCFQELPKEIESEYARYDRPVPSFRSVHGRCPALYRGRLAWRDSGFPYAPREWSPLVKPDGRFVADVSIPDGTLLSPGTRFVKIWRLRNSGKIPWACSTSLVRVGGDEMGSVSAVKLQIPDVGLAPEAEMDVAVDLVAPSKAGRYVCYWRLMTPNGVKFGHRVWALIQVASLPAEEKEETVDNNLAEEEADADDDTDCLEVVSAPDLIELEADVVVEGVNVTVEAINVVTEEKHDADEVESLKSELEGYSIIEMPKAGEEEFDGEALKAPAEDPAVTLESMGFTDKSLIKEFLVKNDNDIQRTIDDLVSAADWDPIFEELEDMGFYDAEMNRHLMVKNNGSMKRVVKDLVMMQKF